MPRRRVILLGATACVAGARAQGGISRLGEAIDKAGAQRMLSQRMGKAWLGLLQPELAERARQVLQASELRFQRQLGELLAFAPTPEITGSYKALQHRFGDYRLLLQSPPSAGRVDELLQAAGEVLNLAQLATGQLQARSATAAAGLVNLAGRQRMLSQRLALFFLAHQHGARPQLVQAEAARARAEFEVALQALAEAPEATPAIQANLALARNQWVFLQAALSGESQGQQAASQVFLASENLLAVMEAVTGQFAGQLA